ncbi:MAG: SDR family oxidoreductase [Bacteroidales bacterium]|nr:SDR family oxidoreductase [Bacteroidales bacterium]
MFDLKGRLALITGSSRGLGYTFAEGIGKAGAEIVLNGRDKETLATATLELEEKGIKATYSVFDVNDEDAVVSEVQRIEKEIGPIDILINNAGLNLRHKLSDMPLEDWKTVLDVNLTGAFLLSREVSRGMIARKRGKIINICSMMSELGRPTTPAYAAAKGGLKMFTKALTVELAQYNIQVNGIGPGYFKTVMTKPLYTDKEFDGWICGRTPAGRWGDPEELVGTAVFLSSEASNFVNGQIIYVDGGILAAL